MADRVEAANENSKRLMERSQPRLWKPLQNTPWDALVAAIKAETLITDTKSSLKLPTKRKKKTNKMRMITLTQLTQSGSRKGNDPLRNSHQNFLSSMETDPAMELAQR